MELSETTPRGNNGHMSAPPANTALQVRRVPRLVSPGLRLTIVRPKAVKNRFEWDDPSMPVLEKMNGSHTIIKRKYEKKQPEKLVWQWMKRSPGFPPVGRWMPEEAAIASTNRDSENGPTVNAEDDEQEKGSIERMEIMGRRRARKRTSPPLLVDRQIPQESIDEAGPSTEEYEEPTNTIGEEEVVDVDGGVDPLPIHSSSSPSFSSNPQWPIYEDVSALHRVYKEKDSPFDPIAVAAQIRTRKAVIRSSKTEKQKEEEKRKLDAKKEREAKIAREAREMEEEKEKRKAVDEVIQLKRERRADYVRRLRAEKRMEMGEIEWKKHLEMEKIKRREREKKKMLDPQYIEKKRLRQTIKTRAVRANQSMARLLFPTEREEEVYEDGVFEMDETEETETSQKKNDVLDLLEDEDVEVE